MVEQEDKLELVDKVELEDKVGWAGKAEQMGNLSLNMGVEHSL